MTESTEMLYEAVLQLKKVLVTDVIIRAFSSVFHSKETCSQGTSRFKSHQPGKLSREFQCPQCAPLGCLQRCGWLSGERKKQQQRSGSNNCCLGRKRGWGHLAQLWGVAILTSLDRCQADRPRPGFQPEVFSLRQPHLQAALL